MDDTFEHGYRDMTMLIFVERVFVSDAHFLSLDNIDTLFEKSRKNG